MSLFIIQSIIRKEIFIKQSLCGIESKHLCMKCALKSLKNLTGCSIEDDERF